MNTLFLLQCQRIQHVFQPERNDQLIKPEVLFQHYLGSSHKCYFIVILLRIKTSI